VYRTWIFDTCKNKLNITCSSSSSSFIQQFDNQQMNSHTKSKLNWSEETHTFSKTVQLHIWQQIQWLYHIQHFYDKLIICYLWPTKPYDLTLYETITYVQCERNQSTTTIHTQMTNLKLLNMEFINSVIETSNRFCNIFFHISTISNMQQKNVIANTCCNILSVI
jgi:hypothetical protein